MTHFLSLHRVGLLAAFVLVSLASALQAQTITPFDVPNSSNTIPQANNLFGQVTGYYQDANFVVHGFLRQPNGNIVTFDVSGLPTQATGINNLGQITGNYFGADNSFHGFVRERNGDISTFDAPNSPFPENPEVCEWKTIHTWPAAINLSGQIVGMGQQRLVSITPGIVCAALRFQGFLRNRDGTIVTFVGIGAGEWHEVGPKAINLRGQITGEYTVSDLGVPPHGFLRQPNGTITTFVDAEVLRNATFPTGINRFGQITGSHRSADCNCIFRGFVRRLNGNVVTFDATGSPDTEAASINDRGQITGDYLGVDNAYHGFLRQRNGDITTFDAPGAATGNLGGTFPHGINRFGQITGYYQDANLVVHGFIRSAH
jgi:hypothetical protein